jgi:predicted RNase H-like HicB family nuclease
MSDGETIEDAIKNLNEAKKTWIATSIELGRSIPEPTPDNFT